MRTKFLILSLINWPTLITGACLGLFINGILGFLLIPMVLGTEFNRIRQMINKLPDDIDPDTIRAYYAQDVANRFIPSKDQLSGITNYHKNQR